MPDTFNCFVVYDMYTDPLMDRLLITGFTSLANDAGSKIVPYRSDDTWGYYGIFQAGNVYSTLRYGDTLLFAGYFESVNGQPFASIAGLVGDNWISFGDFSTIDGGVRQLRIIDGELYAVGSFRYVDGHECWGVAKRNGGQWVNVGTRTYPSNSNPNVLDICSYQGKLVVGGEINPNDGLGGDLIQFNGTSWENVGNGLQGCVGSVTALAVYNSELYVGGGIYTSAGAAGHGIVRWNASAWNDVGGDLRDINNTTNNNASASSFLVNDDKLYVGGAFGYAGGLEANQFAIWDGSSWCVTGDSIGTLVTAMAIYHDTLFVNCEDQLQSGPANFVARWGGGALADTCSSVVGLQEVGELSPIRCFPNPAQGSIRISRSFSTGGNPLTITVLDVMGRGVIPPHTLPPAGTVGVSDLSPGVYWAMVRSSENERPVVLRFIKE